MNLTTDRPISCLITRGEATSNNFVLARRQILDIVVIAVSENVSMIQIREKRLTARRLCELTEAVAAVTRGSSTKVLVNDRADIAIACGADGVHLTASSIAANVIRRNCPRDFLVGVSAHSLNDVETAAKNSANFAVFAPVFATPGKGGPLGLETLGEVCDAVRPFPVLALGGIDEANFADVLSAGASGFAAIRAMNDPEKAMDLMEKVRSK